MFQMMSLPLPSLGAVYYTSVFVEVWEGRDRSSVNGVAPRASMHGWLSSATGYRYSYCPYVVSSGNPATLSTYRQSTGTRISSCSISNKFAGIILSMCHPKFSVS